MHVPPIDEPRGPLLRLAYWVSRRRYGTVLTPLKVIYARKPRLAFIAQQIDGVLEKGLSLEPDLVYLVRVHASRLNGCGFCEDLALARAVQERLGMERFQALGEYRTSGLFSERERAALRLVEEATRERRLSDETIALARNHFGDTQLVELVWANAAETYFNLQAAVLGIGSDGLAPLAAPFTGSELG